MSTDQASHSIERGPARKQLRQPTWMRVAEGVAAVVCLFFAYWQLQSEGGFVPALVSGYLGITSAAFALNIKAKFGLLLVAVVFIAGYVYHLSATK